MSKALVFFAAPMALVAACSGATLDAGNVADGGSAADAAAASGGEGGPGATPSGTGVPLCKSDPDCNDVATQSRLSGECIEGRCHCTGGAMLVPGGKCRDARGLGASCIDSSECHPGLECLEFAVHPKDAPCTTQGKQCTLGCDSRAQGNVCGTTFGPGIVCFVGCEGTRGICGARP